MQNPDPAIPPPGEYQNRIPVWAWDDILDAMEKTASNATMRELAGSLVGAIRKLAPFKPADQVLRELFEAAVIVGSEDLPDLSGETAGMH